MESTLVRRAAAGFQIGLSLWLALPGQAAERKVIGGQAPAVAARLQPIGSLPDSTRLNLAISLPLRNQPALAGLLQQIYTPGSPNFHRYLTPAEFAEQFGPAKEDYQALVDFAQANRLSITHIHPNRTLLDVSASVADIRRVLRVNMKVYQHPTEGCMFYAPDSEPSLDVGVAVLAIHGLHDLTLPHSSMKPAPQAPSGTPEPFAASGPVINGASTYVGNDFRNAYAPGVSLDGTGQTAALVEFDGYYPADITRYENTPTTHLRAVPLTNVLVQGYSGAAGKNNEEVAADIEMLVAMAPGLSRIMVYEGSFGLPIDDILNQIATDNLAAQISCSWGVATDAATDQIFQQYAAQGQSFFQASGDSGASRPGQAGALEADPYVTSVGGTQLSTTNGAAWSANSESAWSGSGGGYSTNYAIPAWQAGVSMSANQGSTTCRNAPDVAMCATNIFVIYGNGSTNAARGTSCAAPLWAGFMALVNQQAASNGNVVGFLNPAIYAIGQSSNYTNCFHDIITGNTTNFIYNTSNYFAVPGYDLCTGWGTPNGSNLINTLAPPDTLAMLPIPGFTSSGPAGGPFSVTMESFSLTNAGAAALNWSLGQDSLWLSVSPTSGSLNPGGTATVVASLNSAASSLLCGDYAAHFTVTNLSNGLLHHRTFTLILSDPLTASPATGLEFAGPPSGPFDVAAQTCWLTNAGQASVNWAVLSSPAWLSISPGSGTVAPYGTAAVTCSLNSFATNLASTNYSGSIVFTNLTFGAEETLPALLLAGQLVQNGGFETGDFSDWTLTGDNVDILVNGGGADGVHSGDYCAQLGSAGQVTYVSQTIPTVPGQKYSVSMWLESDGLLPNEFTVSWGGTTVWSSNNLPAFAWTNLQFVLPATSTNTVLAIGSEDDPGYIGLDDIRVTAAPPTIGSVSPASGPACGGTLVTITGAGFQSHATAAFGSTPAASASFNSTSNITVLTPASAIGLANVTITNADGQTAVLTNGFRFIGSPVITWANPTNIIYGTALGAVQLDATANVPGTFTYNPANGTVLSAGSNQTLSVTFAPADSTNYNSATFSVAINVQQAPLTITASNQSMTYGGSLPALTVAYAGFVNGDTPASLSTPPTVSTTVTSASPAGIYTNAISVSGAADPNYAITYVPGTLMVSPAPLAVTAVNASRAYAAANPAFSATITGFVNGDTSAVVSGAPGFSTTATMSSTAGGTYTITPALGSLSAANYQFVSFVNGTLTITQATPVITWTNPPPITYGDAVGDGQLDATANTPGTFTYNPTNGTVLSAGSNQTLSVTFAPADSTNYNSATNSVAINVQQASLTITASNQSMTYGGSLPALTVSYAGFVNGDTAASLSTPPAVSTTVTSASPAGIYTNAISVSGAADPNYAITCVPGTMTVLAPVPPAIQTATQSNNIFMFSWSATAGETYQVQYNTDLTSGVWTDLGSPIVATNDTASFTNAITGGRSFYRVLLMPQ